MRHNRLLLALVAISGLASFARADGPYYEVHYAAVAHPDVLRYAVNYTLWVPDGVEKLRGVIVHQHGCGKGACQGGATAAYDLHWQALARKWDCALLGPSFEQEDKQDCRLWCDPRHGSRQTFLRALDDFAGSTKHAELKTIPWCLWGHSGGGFWASLMQTSDPERIVAIWLRSGTAYAVWGKGEIAKPEIPAAAYGIPTMCNPGRKERGPDGSGGAWNVALAMFEAYRAHGAPIGFASDPRTGHECGDARYLAIPYFDACLALRLPDKGSESRQLKPVDLKQGWLADSSGEKTPQPAASFDGDATKAAWLPNQSVANAWTEYIKTGAVSDTTPPPAPTDARVAVNADGKTEITWNAVADFESGVQQFIVRRGGQSIGQVPDKPIGRFGRPLFQTMSYHDTPEKPLPAMLFVDPNPGAGDYEVISVNSVGLQSKPAAVAK